jgi:L-glyceraldehyde reductase
VSNMSPSHIEALITATGVAPAVNEIERHAKLQQPESIAAFKKQGVHVIGYSPLGAVYDEDKQIKDDPVIKKIADKHSTQPASILIAWQLATGFSVIPKSTTPERIVSNLEAANVKLDDDDLKQIEALGKDYTRFNIPYTYEPQWDIVSTPHPASRVRCQVLIASVWRCRTCSASLRRRTLSRT